MREAENADWAVVYFAGHGIEVGGANWLIPVDAAIKADRDIRYEAVPLDHVLGVVDGTRKLALEPFVYGTLSAQSFYFASR